LITIILFRVIFVATLFSLVIGPVGYWMARKTGLVDVPGTAPHKTRNTTIPVAGCLAFIALFLPPVFANGVFGSASLAGIGTLAFLDDKKRWP
jgi:UDP-N-acetylmuramyl pentapeptide phosphotransferase/UDP-N-acetylglucosamine-1-phosphate transferase